MYGATHDTLFVFDIETVPDTECVPALTGEPADGYLSEEEMRERLTEYHLQVTGGRNPFPRQPFHKVAAISFLEAEITADEHGEYFELRELRSGGKRDASEEELLEGFFSYLGRSKARLVSFNGRGFDLPVLKYRAMRHGISAGNLFNRGDKWNNYSQRYSTDWHCDLLDVFSDYGASARVKMQEVCAGLRIPGKLEVSGGDVTELYDAKDIDAIRDYCETDVLSTYLLYLRWCYFNGKIRRESYNTAVTDVATMLQEEAEERPHLGTYFEAWDEVCGGRFMIDG